MKNILTPVFLKKTYWTHLWTKENGIDPGGLQYFPVGMYF